MEIQEGEPETGFPFLFIFKISNLDTIDKDTVRKDMEPMKKITMIGNAHLDPVWLWQWQEGYQEIKATFQSALDRMEETQEFVFTCACAAYYQWVEENAPEMFAQIQKRVAEGRWIIVGGMWIQPDMNTPSGESFVRQLLYSQRYFYEKFGRIATVGYNVDSFGHNAALPQIYAQAGIKRYVWMRPDHTENPDIPDGAMLWEGIDGTRMQAFRIFHAYLCAQDIPERVEELLALSQRLGQPVMCFYGVGNHGGGPTIENLRQIRDYQQTNVHGGEVVFGSPDSYFDRLAKEDLHLPVWRGELQHHASGCYSTHSQSKLLHCLAENSLLRMETLSVLSNRLTGHRVKAYAVRQAWENLLFNEFHDVMGGCCIREAMEDAVTQLSETVSIAQREENALLQRLSWQVDTSKGNPVVRSKEESPVLWGIRGQGTPVVVFNPHAFEVEDTVRICQPIRAARDENGNPVPVQTVRASRLRASGHRKEFKDYWDGIFRARVPALGYRLYWVFLKEEPEALPAPVLQASETVLENAWIRAEFQRDTGALIRLTDKRTGFEALTGATSAQLMNVEACDTWAHGVFRFDQAAGKLSGAEVVLLETGPARAVLEVTTRYAGSTLRLRYVLYADADQLEVDVRLDMHTRYRLLKLCFPTCGARDVAKIAYGVLERNANGNEEHCQRWVAAQGKDGGLAILNNGKYSYSMQDGTLYLTVSNTSAYADHFAQADRDRYVEWMDQGEQAFRLALVPYSGSWRDAGLDRRAAVLNQPLPRVVETYHKGTLEACYCGIRLSSQTVNVGAIKPAEDGQGWVVRLVEAVGMTQTVQVELLLLGRTLTVDLAPFQIKTLYLPQNDAAEVREIGITEFGGIEA